MSETELEAAYVPAAGQGAAGQGSGPVQTALEASVARLIVESLHLEMDPGDIDPEGPLFGEGLGLDSIDALELALAISRSYGFELKSDDECSRRAFASLRSLSRHIETCRTR